MSKGGGRGSGGSAGALSAAVRAVRKLGVMRSDYQRDGMRSLAEARGAFEGASAAEATAIATGKRAAKNTGRTLPPVTVVVDKGDVILRDGRHRATAAAEAGATSIRATVITYHRGRRVETVTNVKL